MEDESKDNFDFRWEVKDFSSDIIETGEAIVSPTFVAKVLDDTKWFLSVYPRGKESDEFVEIFVTRCSEDEGGAKIPMICTFELEAADSTRQERRVSPNLIFERNSTWGVEQYIRRKSLLEDVKSTFLPGDVLTIHCRLERAPSDVEYVTQYLAEEYFETVDEEVLWTIHNWREMSEVEKDVEFSGEHEGKFRMIICGSTNSDKELVLELKKIEPSSKSADVNLRIAVLDAEGSEVLVQSSYYRLSDKPLASVTGHLFNREDIQDSFLKEGALSLRCILSMETGERSYRISEKVVGVPIGEDDWATSVGEDLVKEFGNMCRDGDLSDVKLRAGSEVVNSHSGVLEAGSEVLFDMWKTAEVYSENGVEKRDIVIEDLDGDTLVQMINFLHTDDVEDVNPASALKLFVAGHKYKVEDLKRRCAIYLSQAFTFQNVYDIPKTAHAYDDWDLKGEAINYLHENFSLIRMTTEFKNFMDTEKEFGSYVYYQIQRLRKL